MANRAARDAIVTSDSPTAAVRIAFDAATDRKAVIQLAADAADSLRPNLTIMQLLRPLPDPLEALERWIDVSDEYSADRKLLTRIKAGLIGFLTTSAATLLAKVFLGGDTSPEYGAVAWLLAGAFVITACLTTILVAGWLNWCVRRDAARLDEHSALDLVVGLIDAWAPRNTKKLSDVHARLKRKLPELLDAAAKPDLVELAPRPIAPAPHVWPDYPMFRAAHATVQEAIAHCPRPDWLVRLAVEALPSRKKVLQLASDAASVLRASNRDRMLKLITPYPRRLEVIDAYSANKPLRDHASTRAWMLALVPASILTYIGDNYIWGSLFGAFHYQVATIIMFAFVVVISRLVKGMLALVVRMRAARLDDDKALRIVIEEIDRGMTLAPVHVPGATDAFKRRLQAILKRSDIPVDGDAPASR